MGLADAGKAAGGTADTSAPKPASGPGSGPGLGLYFLGALVVVSLADTRAAPVVVAFLAAAAIYNANVLIDKYGSAVDVPKAPQATDPFSGKGYRFTW